MLLKCCTQYVSKFGKLSSGHRTGKGQFLSQSQRKAMPKSAQTTVLLRSFHMLARLCSKSFKLGFNSTWIENFQMYKLSLEKAEEPKIKLPTFVGSWRKQGSSRKTSTFASLTMLKPLTVWITTLWKILKDMGIPVSWETFIWVKKQEFEPDIEQLTGSKLWKKYNKAIITLFI